MGYNNISDFSYLFDYILVTVKLKCRSILTHNSDKPAHYDKEDMTAEKKNFLPAAEHDVDGDKIITLVTSDHSSSTNYVLLLFNCYKIG